MLLFVALRTRPQSRAVPAPNLEIPTMKKLIVAVALVATSAFATEPAKAAEAPAPAAAEAKTEAKAETKAPEAAPAAPAAEVKAETKTEKKTTKKSSKKAETKAPEATAAETK
jgi:hypothetical protein